MSERESRRAFAFRVAALGVSIAAFTVLASAVVSTARAYGEEYVPQDGVYELEMNADKGFLDVKGYRDGFASGAAVQYFTYGDDEVDCWRLESLGPDQYKLSPCKDESGAGSGLALDVQDGVLKAGQGLRVNTDVSSSQADSAADLGATQRFAMTGKYGGYYMLQPYFNKSLALCASGFSARDPIQLAAADFTLYSQQIRFRYYISFDANGGSGEMGDVVARLGVGQTLPECGFVREGYYFAGWSTSPDGDSAYGDGDYVIDVNDPDNLRRTLYARWMPQDYVLNDSDGDGKAGGLGDQRGEGTFEVDEGVYIIRNCFYNRTLDLKSLSAESGLGDVAGDYLTVSSTKSPENTDVAWYVRKEDGHYRLYPVQLNGDLGQSFDMSGASRRATVFYDRVLSGSDTIRVPDGGQSAKQGYLLYALSENSSQGVSLFDFHPLSIRDEGATQTATAGQNSGFAIQPSQSIYALDTQSGAWSWQRSGVLDMFDQTVDGWVIDHPLWVGSKSNETAKYINDYGGEVQQREVNIDPVENLRAQIWQLSYAVVFHLNGGDAWEGAVIQGSGEDDYVVEYWDLDGTSHELPCPSRKGYVLEGWAEEQDSDSPDYDFGVGYERLQLKDAGSVYRNLYAVWHPAEYSVSFDANGGDGQMDPQEFSFDEKQPLNANSFTRSGYAFKGWNTSADGSGTSYEDCEEVSNLCSDDGGNVVLYAQWEKAVYTVTVPTLIRYEGGVIGSVSETESFDISVQGQVFGEIVVQGEDTSLAYGDDSVSVSVASSGKGISFLEPGVKQDSVQISGQTRRIGLYEGCVGYTVTQR